MTTVYVPGLEEKDPNKIIRSLQQIGPRLETAEGNITTNTTNIATNTASITAIQAAWSTYTPTVTSGSGTITTVGAVTGRYKQNGKTVHAVVTASITTKGTGAGVTIFTLPVTAANNYYLGTSYESALTGKSGGAIIVTGDSTHVSAQDSTGSTYLANGAFIVAGLTYEAV